MTIYIYILNVPILPEYINYEKDVDEGNREFQDSKYDFAARVENAVQHGIQRCMETGKIE